MTTTPRAKKSTLELRLSMNHKTSEAMQSARRSCVGAYELGGATGVLWITMCRDSQGLFASLAELDELLKLQALAMAQMELEDQAERVTQAATRERAEASHSRIVERARRDREAEERRFLERCAGQPLSSQRKIQSECRIVRPSDVVAERVLSELTAQGPSPLLEEEESTPEINDENGLDQARDACIDHPAGDGDSRYASTEQRADLAVGVLQLPDLRASPQLTPKPAPTRSHSRRAKGEVGERLGGKIDKLLEEIRSDSSVDPPSMPLGAEARGTDDNAISTGVTDGFPIPTLSDFDETAWQRLTTPDEGGQPSTLGELIDALDASPELRSASLLRSMERFRDVLDVLPSDCPVDAPQTLLAGDVVVLIKAVMSRLR